MRRVFDPKAPWEEEEFDFDWSGRLAPGDALASSSWTVPPGLVDLGQSRSGARAIVKLGGGVAPEAYVLVNRVVTTGGRKLEFRATLPVTEELR